MPTVRNAQAEMTQGLDQRAQVESSWPEISAEIAKANNIEVYICSVLPAKDFPWSPGLNPAEKVVRLNNILENYARYTDYDNKSKSDERSAEYYGEQRAQYALKIKQLVGYMLKNQFNKW